MILKKLGEEYKLYGEDDSCIATTQESPHKRLSKQNCDEIFGVVDVEKLAVLTTKEETTFVGNGKMAKGFIKGFNKAIELNKDKLFGIKEVVELCKILLSSPFEKCGKTYQELTDNYIQSLQQPKEIEVKIDMWFHGTRHEKGKWIERLDENGCLILKKK